MAINIGNIEVAKFYLGTEDDIKIYLGDTLLYPTTPSFQGKFMAEYSDSTSYSADCDSSTELTTATTKPSGYEYTAMTEAVIGDCVTTLGVDLFRDCSGLTKVNSSVNGLFNIPSGITSIGDNAFRSCVSAATINLPNSVTTIGTSAFRFCINLTDITLPSGLTTINSDMFDSCRSLTSIDIPNTVTDIRNSAFTKCYRLETIEIPNSVRNIGGYVFQNCSGLTSCTIGSGVTSIGGGTFTKCTSLTSIDIPDSVRNIAYDAFANCSGLTSCTIGSGVKSIGAGAFSNCRSLTSITVNAIDPPQLGNNNVFSGSTCPIYVPCESVGAYKSASRWSDYADRITCKLKFTAKYSDGHTYSAECDSSSLITTATTKPSGYEYTAMTEAVIGDCVSTVAMNSFSGFTSLSSVTISDNVTTLANKVFKDCISLSEVKLPSGINKILSNTFENCTSLKNIDIPSGVTMIGGFENCTSLENITLPNALSEIYGEAFRGCTSLTSIDIPSGVTSIGSISFIGCTSLLSITVEATTPAQLGTKAFDNTNNCPIYVPSQSVEAYKSASVWSDYASRIQAIPNS